MLVRRMKYLSNILHSCPLLAIFLSKNSLFKPRLQRVIERRHSIPVKNLLVYLHNYLC